MRERFKAKKSVFYRPFKPRCSLLSSYRAAKCSTYSYQVSILGIDIEHFWHFIVYQAD